MVRALALIVIALFAASCDRHAQKVDAFRARFLAECSTGMKQATGKDMSVMCGCIAEKLIARKPIDELMDNPPQEDVDRAAEECGREQRFSLR